MDGYEHSPEPISQYMKLHKLSQKDFARQMDVSQSAVSQWLSKEKGISLVTAKKLEKRSCGEIKVRALFPKLFASTTITSEAKAA